MATLVWQWQDLNSGESVPCSALLSQPQVSVTVCPPSGFLGGGTGTKPGEELRESEDLSSSDLMGQMKLVILDARGPFDKDRGSKNVAQSTECLPTGKEAPLSIPGLVETWCV